MFAQERIADFMIVYMSEYSQRVWTGPWVQRCVGLQVAIVVALPPLLARIYIRPQSFGIHRSQSPAWCHSKRAIES